MIAGTLGTFIGFALLILFISILLFSVGRYSGLSNGEGKIDNQSVLFIPLTGEIVERKGNMFLDWEEDSPFFRGPRHVGLWEMQQALIRAKTDKRIQGVYLKLGPLSSGWASLNTLVESLLDFKKSGKFIYAYGENFDEKSYFVASTSQQIIGYPEGSFEFNGLAAVTPFLKGTLDKLGIKPQIFRVGEYKSAIEIFIQEKMSEANRKQTSELITDIWNTYIGQISKLRHLSQEDLNRFANELSITKMTQALELKMIDDIASETQVLEKIKSLAGTPKDQKLNLISFTRYERTLSEKDFSLNHPSVGVLFASGEIISGSSSEGYIGSDDIVALLRQMGKEKNIKAIVLRINSPGGSALAADIIAKEINEIKKTKPVVASLGDTAASGGYYIAAGADQIFSLPQTITGSIGVFGVMFNAQNFLNQKLGITFDRVVSHNFADMGNSTREMTPMEHDKIQADVEHTYQQFLKIVQQGRNFKTIEEIEPLAQGRVWSGIQAQKLKLIDQMGDLSRAIEAAAKLAKLDPQNGNVEIYPREKSSLQQFLQLMSDMTYGDDATLFPSQFHLTNEIKTLNHFHQHWKKLDPVLTLETRSWEIK